MSGQYRRVILHVGRHKTGTSSLQRALANASVALRDVGVLYPKKGRRGVAHHPLARAFLEKTQRDPEAARAGAAAVVQVAKEIGGWRGDVVLSSEVFQNVQDPARIAELVDPSRCEVVLYLRERYGYVQSAYAQIVHAKQWSGSFADYLGVFETDYAAFLARWEGFGSARLHVRPFDRSALVDGDVIADFAATAGLPAGVLAGSGRDANPSIGGALLEFKRALNGLGDLPPDFAKGYNVLSRIAAREPAFRIKPQAPPELAMAYRRRFGEALAELTGRYPALRVLAPGDEIILPLTFGIDDFRSVWRALDGESPAFAASCRRALEAAPDLDPTLRLIAAAGR